MAICSWPAIGEATRSTGPGSMRTDAPEEWREQNESRVRDVADVAEVEGLAAPTRHQSAATRQNACASLRSREIPKTRVKRFESTDTSILMTVGMRIMRPGDGALCSTDLHTLSAERLPRSCDTRQHQQCRDFT
jgi:hypothetical protein